MDRRPPQWASRCGRRPGPHREWRGVLLTTMMAAAWLAGTVPARVAGTLVAAPATSAAPLVRGRRARAMRRIVASSASEHAVAGAGGCLPGGSRKPVA
ncbi:hypothetical protein [Burkholderia perseverans]|uniref:hypothetical protein n=1 Tax=Burkholderia perseverans TaxID=2615214 RepID=UPI001FEF3B16|nr:hypothetical protein [Burkholderia perseverans]